ncbi:S-adenosyl-L-methionine-dependent methyltransferase [Daldinia decipiens]|uniref:S-adenosyl-L-methionine-dependent methyltransferase n=1 Tax=Daldinia decipiens TaxID=326647 RepID=UPI0020C55256|nr:S-adenosyl-L-methionine-dependent methyltransferase [Daldinia decipiens]KAI1658421.1 S-adenosyl-L-methionine-dependent methyltransferase [Daldinia decipiens]
MPVWIKTVIREPMAVHLGHTLSRTYSLHADTEEVTDEVRETFTHHNRIYQRCSVDRRIYLVPIDEDETIRLRIQYDVLAMVFDGRSIFPPMGALRRVLDCGFGTGMWAFQVAWENPRCEARIESFLASVASVQVSSPGPQGRARKPLQPARFNHKKIGLVIGIDVSPHHYNPEESVDNLYLNVDNLNMPLSFPSNHFDLVNSRLVAGGIDRNRWIEYIRDILRCLRRGGWCQMVEIDYNAQSDNGTLTDGHALRQWSDKYSRAMSQLKNVEAPRRLAHWMRQAGFTDVEERMIPLPMCGWSDSQRDFDIGVHNQENVRLLLGSLALYPFTELLNMTITEFHVLVAQARAEATNPALKKAEALRSAGASLAALPEGNLAAVERQGIRRVKADAG